MSLADSIYEANANPPKMSFSEELVDRVLEKSQCERPDKFSVYQLHRREEKIWYGHNEVQQTAENVYRLTGCEERIPVPVLINFWVKLLPRLPELYTDVIQISGNLFWDKTNGEVITYEQIQAKFGIQAE